MKINEAKTHATIKIDGDLSTQQLEQLMRDLALLRAQMQPEVPATLQALNVDTNVLIEDQPALNIALRQIGGFRLWLRHKGYGWLAYQIDERTAAGVYAYLATRLGPSVNLISDGSGQRH